MAGGEVENSASCKRLRQPQNHRQFIITSGSRNRMHGSGHTLIPVIGFSRSGGEGTVLQEEGLVPGKSMLKEVSLPRFVLAPQAVLMEDGIEFPLRLGGDIIIQVFVPIGDVFPEVHLSQMNPAFKRLIPVVCQHTAFVICLQDGEEEHVLDVGSGHYPPTLAHRTGWLDPDLLLDLSADDGFGVVGIGRVTGMGHIGMQSVSQKLLEDCDWTVLRSSDVPQVGKSFRMAVSVVPRTRQRQLVILVNDLIIFDG